jgi:Flp pilus assembly protein TadD
MRSLLGLFLLLIFACLPSLAATPEEALASWKSGDYASAVPLLKSVTVTPECAESIRSALLSALVYQGNVDEATVVANGLSVDFPNSPTSMAARGEFYFYMADFGQAEKLFMAAIKLKEDTARAHHGLARLLRAAAYYRSARIHIPPRP